MSRHPVRHVSPCCACGGSGQTEDQDYDEDRSWTVRVRCEACDGTGQLADCDLCDEPMPLSEAELNGYVCGPCKADAERGDAAAEMARIRRMAS